MKVTFQELTTKRVIVRAVKTSLVVGSILNLINQGDVLMAMDFENLQVGKLILTYCVPLIVSGFSIARTNSLSQR
jgi:hypothetical protein